jgi:hypothetical protein
VLLAWTASLWLAACGADGRYVVICTMNASSASGTIEVDRLDAGSTQVAIHLEFLHAPNRVSEHLNRYLVWLIPAQGSPVLSGPLKYNSEQRTGDLTATSPFRHFGVKITAERDEHPKAPSEYVIATQEIKLD